MKTEKSLPTITDVAQLQLLLSQNEGATLEFKREWYKLNSDGETRRRQGDELIKDILSLANGNAYSAGETAFLIVGVDDQRDENGMRALHDIGDSIPTSSSILSLVMSACDPPLQELEAIPFEVEGKRLLAIVIPPSPHLYETTRKIDTPAQSYSKHVVFIRHNENVDLASAKEREIISKLKQIRFSDTRNAPPFLLGTGVGAAVGGTLLAAYGEKITGKKEGTIGGLIAGTILGSLLGGVVGSTYKSMMEMRPDWTRASGKGRIVALAAGGLSALIVWGVSSRLGRKITQMSPSGESLRPT